ncbi:MAG: hypothetical protein MI746_15665 [Pseudomonadales bacterium]|nr:hypothetical protein [Pseudomonadales bacterium]
MSKKRDYEDKVREKLNELEAEIEALREHVKEMEAELLPEHEEHFERLHALQAVTKAKFKELVDSSEETYDTVRSKLEEYWSSLGREVKAFDQKVKDGESTL